MDSAVWWLEGYISLMFFEGLIFAQRASAQMGMTVVEWLDWHRLVDDERD